MFQLSVFICFWVSSVTLEHGQFGNGSHISSSTSKETRKQNTLWQNLPAPNCTSPCERIQDQILSNITYQKGYFAFVDEEQSIFGDATPIEAQMELGQTKLCRE